MFCNHILKQHTGHLIQCGYSVVTFINTESNSFLMCARYTATFPSRFVKKGNGWFIPIRTEYVELLSANNQENDYDISVSIPEGHRISMIERKA